MDQQFVQKKVVVTGAAGFLGSHLVDALLAQGADVIGIDNFITGSKLNLSHLDDNSNFHFIQADVIKQPETYLVNVVPDYLFHFASPASPPQYQKYPVETYLVNSWATHQLLTFLRKQNPKATFIFAGTSEAYGDPQVHPQSETYWGNVNPNGVRSCYDESKRMGETICGVFYRDFGFDTRIVRIFNTYGPRMSLDDGRVIPNLISLALQKKPLSIYGDGSQTRSYCYVTDLIAGIIAVSKNNSCSGETINLGNPGEFTILETAKEIEKVLGSSEYVYKPLPADDPLQRKPDIKKAKSILGWEPTIAFPEGLAKTIAFFLAIKQ